MKINVEQMAPGATRLERVVDNDDEDKNITDIVRLAKAAQTSLSAKAVEMSVASGKNVIKYRVVLR